MEWYITDGVLQKEYGPPNPCSILTQIKSKAKVVIPEGVTAIGDKAFNLCHDLKSVTIPDTVRSIGKDAFSMCSSLERVTLPEGVTAIGEEAFAGCRALKEIEIPNSVADIGEGAFAWNRNLRTIHVPSHHPLFYVENDLLISRDGRLLWANPKMRCAVLGQDVRSIGGMAFAGCDELTEITISDSVTSIAEGAFSWCRNLRTIHISADHPMLYMENELLISKEGVLLWANPEVSRAVIPQGVTHIGNRTFSGCANLTDVIMSKGVTVIGNEAFAACKGLKNINLPEGVSVIGNEAFVECRNLKNINIPQGVSVIGESAFGRCISLTEVTLPDSLLMIGGWGFSGCSALMEITIPKGMPHIETGAFSNCWNLRRIVLPDGLTGIETFAFSECPALQSVEIPDSVTYIGEYVFGQCRYLRLPSQLWTKMDKETLKRVKAVSCPISLKDAPANVRIKLCIGFALNQGNYSDQLRAEYTAYIKKNAAKLVEAALEYPELLHLMCREKLIAAKDIDEFTQEAMRRENTEATAVLLNYQANVLTMKEVSKARAKKEQIREKQDEVIVERMEARADKAGIGGLNFVVTGRLKKFAGREDIKAYITALGGKLLSAMSAKTDYLITNDTDSGSEKNKKAAQLGIVVITEDEFMQMAEGKQE